MRLRWTKVEARIESHYCYKWEEDPDKSYCKALVLEKPNDVHTQTAKKISEIIGQPFQRGAAKSVKYASSYGAQAAKIAKTVGCDVATAELIFAAFWEAAKPLALLKEALTKYWETSGKRSFIMGIDKRKIPTRSKHALVNSLFQSAGVICAKRAMVLHDRALKKEGLIIDFFKDDFRNKSFCQQMVAYHDESQLELSRQLVKLKVFPIPKSDNEEEQKIFTKETEKAISSWKKEQETLTGLVFSDVGHNNDCFYVGYCRAGELAVKAVNDAGKYYNLNIDLTAGYMIGNSWKTCH